jgi:hypothetical protein
MIQQVARRAFGTWSGRRTRPYSRSHAFEALEPRQLWAAAPPEEVFFQDVGVGGGELFNVSEPLYVSVAPFGNSAEVDDINTYEQVYNHTVGPLRTQIRTTPADDLEGPLDVFGMPTMAGKVMVFDVRPLNAEDIFDFGYAKTYFYNPGTPYNPADDEENPGIVPTNLHIDLSYGSFARFTSVTPEGAPGPTLAHNPFIGPDPVLKLDPSAPPDDTPGVTMAYGGKNFTGSFLLDTGGQVSLLSQHGAAALGVTYAPDTYGTDQARLVDASGNTLPDQFSMEVGGIGGSTTLAGFYLDSTTVQTEEGTPIRYLSDPVLVLDITVADQHTGDELTLDGVFGVNHLITSFDPTTFNINSGPYDWLTFDEPNGVLGVNMIGLGATPPPRGTPIDVEGVQLTAAEFLRVNALIRYTPDGEPIVAEADGLESFNIQGILDTGASGVLLSLETAQGLGLAKAMYSKPEGVAARHVFYNNSSFDGHSATANAADDGAVAVDKHALLPGDSATFENVSSYAKGINGVMVDVADLPAGATPTAADFTFRVGKTANTGSWTAAPAPTGVTVRRGAGQGGTDRVTVTFADGAIKNTWLQVTVKADAATGLAAPDVFYFGNLIGDTGSTGGAAAATNLAVNAIDLGAVKRALNSTSVITGAFDFDRDGRVNALDLGAIKANLNRTLELITPAAAALAGTSQPATTSITREILK